MNKRDKDILLALKSNSFQNQRDVASFCGCSLGAANASINNLISEGFVKAPFLITEKAEKMLVESAPKRAVLLAAGYGMRSSSAIGSVPHALLEIKGEPIIERFIKQLHSVGVFEIYIVVGYAKERFEYLIDKYGVELIVNTEYARRQTLHSLFLAKEHLENCYIVHCDTWCKHNPFNNYELYSWYMVSDAHNDKSFVRVNRKGELAVTPTGSGGDDMTGIAYVVKEKSAILRERLTAMDADYRYNFCFWEDALYESGKLILDAKTIHFEDIREISNFEDMLELDSEMSVPIDDIAQVLTVAAGDIKNITVLKKGAVNCSYTFICRGEKYVVRVPSYCISKQEIQMHESSAYEALNSHGIATETVYVNDTTGLKISKFIDNVRPCDPFSENDVSLCIEKLKQIHSLKLKVPHRFDLFGSINLFESLWGGDSSVYPDYLETKENVFSLRPFIAAHKKEECLTHIDPVYENFLIPIDNPDTESVHLIDWEYAAMQDPHLDIAMFCLYSLYGREQVDWVIDKYFGGTVPQTTRIKIYCYMAAAGLLWSNWCESKYKQGIEFGIYALKQYRYAKEYFRIANDLIKEL